MWRVLADRVMRDVDWSHFCRVNYVMVVFGFVAKPASGLAGVRTFAGQVTVSSQLFGYVWNGHAKPWMDMPTFDQIIFNDLVSAYEKHLFDD